MAAYLVTYDLRNPQRDYSKLYTRLNAWRALQVLESVHVINSDSSTSASLRADLAGYVDSNDGLFVAKLTGEAAWQRVNCDNQALKNKLTA